MPTLGWHKSFHGQARNQIRELILVEITWRGEIQVVGFFAGIKSLAEFSIRHTQMCLHSASGEQPAVKAAGSITGFQLCCYPLSNHYPGVTFAKC